MTTLHTPRRVFLSFLLVAIALGTVPAWGQSSATATEISAEALLERIEQDDDLLVLDVRTPEEFAEGHVPGAINIPHTELADRLDEVRAAGDVDVVIYCRSGRRAGIAHETLDMTGFARLHHLTGDMLGWLEKGLPVETPGR